MPSPFPHRSPSESWKNKSGIIGTNEAENEILHARRFMVAQIWPTLIYIYILVVFGECRSDVRHHESSGPSELLPPPIPCFITPRVLTCLNRVIRGTNRAVHRSNHPNQGTAQSCWLGQCHDRSWEDLGELTRGSLARGQERQPTQERKAEGPAWPGRC